MILSNMGGPLSDAQDEDPDGTVKAIDGDDDSDLDGDDDSLDESTPMMEEEGDDEDDEGTL